MWNAILFLLFTFVTLLDFFSFSRKINSSVANLTNKDHRWDCYRCNNRQTVLHRKRGKTLFLSMIVSTLQLQYSLFLSLSFARSETSSIETVSTGSTFVFNNSLEKGRDKLLHTIKGYEDKRDTRNTDRKQIAQFHKYSANRPHNRRDNTGSIR